MAALGGQRNQTEASCRCLCGLRAEGPGCCVVSESLLSLWQAGRKTYAMVSDRFSGHALASELVESHDGHEEIIKVSLVHVPFFFLLPHILQVCEGSC